MDVKLVLLLSVFLIFAVLQKVDADFYYNHPNPKNEDLSTNKLKCVPGRTFIRIKEKLDLEEPEDSDEEDYRRTHMTFKTDDETCQVCICSVEGKDEYCSNRPAKNVNECIRLASLTDKFQKNVPFDHERSLSWRIRRVGDVSPNKVEQEKCIPFLSQYSDCSEGTMCRDCTLCTCNAQSKWDCKQADSCAEVFQYPPIDEMSLKQAFSILETEMEDYEKSKEVKKPDHVVPTPEDDEVLGKSDDSIDDELKALIRMKRSSKQMKGDDKMNKTGNFHYTLDEDTLKNDNTTGTLVANKMDPDVKISRRTDVFNHNISNLLQIEHKNSIHHITDNKIDENVQTDPQIDEKIHQVIGNNSMKAKDKTLSKLIVNELKPGTEIIGDKSTPIMSNITFAPENDTLVAMAYIAGNLLNKLWNMEKEASSESFETEVLKHEKISDLVELFKEPLSLRQETFLKNALAQLSNAINNNDGENLTICESLNQKNLVTEKYEQNKKDKKKCKNSRKSDKTENVSKEAVDKIMNVLNLINKFEHVQKDLSTKRNRTLNKDGKNIAIESKLDLLSEDETASLNTFGSILEKITKLLMPNKNGKKMASKIKYQNIFSHTNDFKKKFKTLYNVDLNNITISTKDKLIIDYLTHIEKNPDCLLNEKSHGHETKSIPQLEGDILLNLSEFFKIKSYSDIITLLDNKQRPKESTQVVFRASERSDSIESTTKVASDNIIHMNDDATLALTKEKLKKHLKTVLEDLIALQSTKNGGNGSDIKVTDALPCIYNLLNAGKKQPTRRMGKSLKNVKAVFDYLKNEIQLPLTRRSNIVRQRPKSAVVWERVIKNLNKKKNIKTRRNLEIGTSKSLDEIKDIIDKTESSGSNTYKNLALLSEVTPADRLVLLKTLNADVKKYQQIFEDLKASIEFNPEIPNNYLKDFIEFADNVAININLNKKVVKTLKRQKSRKVLLDDNESRTDVWQNKFVPNRELKKASKFPETILDIGFNDNIKLTRDQIINHLIKNRIKVYLNAKEADDSFLNDDINYGIAKNIIMNLDRGNDVLARELFKIFASNKQNNSKRLIAPPPLIERQLPSIANKVPLIQFEDQKFMLPQTNQDQLIKQLLNIKNMKM
ncbi:hypothetical protein K1T71_012802 [Dendrolimus kikuchii]|uniref:Uncharacterized protein n=1 Tax=Dendrolimus kikuchii TaxID=765133 RepID=A0ACC1CIF3_9NEOP|nr:hypothetical protein K1T71_012802 [Dendrolimus kikuchii]